MPDFASALHERLATDPQVAAMVVAAGKRRIYPTIVPAGATLPYIRYQTISDPRPQHLKGYEGARVTRVQCDCFAATYAVARSLAEKVIAALGTPGVTEGVHFGRIKAEGPRDLGEDVEGVEGVSFVYRASVDLLVEHKLA